MASLSYPPVIPFNNRKVVVDTNNKPITGYLWRKNGQLWKVSDGKFTTFVEIIKHRK